MLTYKPRDKKSSDEADRRMAICRACEHRRDLTASIVQCRRCGCVMNAKTKLSGAKCPISKW